MLKFVFFLLILKVSAQEFKQFVFPEQLASALDAAAARSGLQNPRGVVSSVTIPESREEGLNDPGRPYSMSSYSMPSPNPHPQPDPHPQYPHPGPSEPQQPYPAPSEPQQPYSVPTEPQQSYSVPSEPRYPYPAPSQPEQPHFPPVQLPPTAPRIPQAPRGIPQPATPKEVPLSPYEVPIVPVPTTLAPPGPKEPYEINFCDKNEFPDHILAQHSLERIEYFIYNKSCSGTFFQCSIGQTFLFTCLSEEQAFDPSIVNCNYKYDNRICPEYDHITHCTIKETCTDNQFACCAEPQMCIDLSRRCDSHPDCSNGEDETNCPSCAKDEFACVKSGKCIPTSKRCDGYLDDCGDGSNLDEIGCSKNTTCWGKFVCDSPKTIATLGHSDCIDYELHCNGEKNCPGGEDEMNCRQTGAKYLLCENQKQSVLKEQWCDGQEHCADGSDERYCY